MAPDFPICWKTLVVKRMDGAVGVDWRAPKAGELLFDGREECLLGVKMGCRLCHPCREICARSRRCIQGGEFEKTYNGIKKYQKKRGSSEGATRMPLRSLMLFFNDLALLRIPRKSLKFLASLFSIPTALPITVGAGS